jgi:hypothetical protein
VARGDVIVIRHADDLVVGFENWAEVQRFLEEFRKRLAKLGLEAHAEKTQLIEFGRFAAQNGKQRGEGKPATFTFLGFTYLCGKRQNGAFSVWRVTAKKRMMVKLRAIKAELRRRMHESVASVGERVQQVTLGYYRYHAVPGNTERLHVQRLRRLPRLVLCRRGPLGRATWDRLTPIFERWIPELRILHPYPLDPLERFVATHPRWKP